MSEEANLANDIKPPGAAMRKELDLLAKASRILEITGHGDRIFGHIAMRDPEGRGFWLKRHGISLGEVFDHRDFLLVDFSGDVLYGGTRLHSEWPIHAEILKHRPDLNFTAHTHPFYGTIYSAMDKPLPMIHKRRFQQPPRFEESSDFIRSSEQGAAVAAALGKSKVLFLRHHGVVFCGRSRVDLLYAGIGLEEACNEALVVSASSLTWTVPPATERAGEWRTPESSSGRDRDLWDYYCRLLARAEEEGDRRLSKVPVAQS